MAEKIILIFLCLAVSQGQARLISKANRKKASPPVSELTPAPERKISSVLFVNDPLKQFQPGLVVTGNSNYAALPYTTNNASGFGYSFGLTLKIPVFQLFVVGISASYQSLTMSVNLPEPTQLESIGSLSVTQNIKYLNASTIVNIPLGIVRMDANAPFRFWVDVGGEYLYALAGSQTDYLGNTISLATLESLIFALIGPSTTFSVGEALTLHCALHGFYNVMSTADVKLYGLRLGASLQYAF